VVVEVCGTLDSVVALLRRRGGGLLFVRYSRGPETDRTSSSTDYESGLVLPGLSVAVLTPEPWWTRPVADWVARRLCSYEHLAGESGERYPWVLRGEVVGRGPDHEPLVAAYEPVSRIEASAVVEARAHYERVFDVGRRSR
jgi:hypothetical protein